MDANHKCQNPHTTCGNFAFGTFRLVTVDKAWTPSKIFEKDLCADCGFNLQNLRQTRMLELDREFTPPTGKAFKRTEDVVFREKLYASITLISVLREAQLFAKEVHMMERAEYLREVERLRAAGKVRRQGEQSHVVVLHLGGVSARRRDSALSAQQEVSSLSSVPLAGAITVRPSPRRRAH